jgi:hypothetical protein
LCVAEYEPSRAGDRHVVADLAAALKSIVDGEGS